MKTKSASQVCLLLVAFAISITLIPGKLTADTHLNVQEGSRYFVDENGKAVYLTGSHTWNNFLDGGWETIGFTNPTTFDYDDYLDWMVDRGQNFIRLWTPENSRDFDPSGGSSFVAVGNPVSPTLYVRDSSTCSTACNGLDGLRKFKLSELNDDYLTHLHDRIAAAKEKNIYVSIMLFSGWGVGVYYGASSSGMTSNEWWNGHPYNPYNNIDSINGGTNEGYNTRIYYENSPSAINELQDAYVLAVLEEVKYFDNVLFEVSNEDYAGTLPTVWQEHIIDLIHTREAEIEAENQSIYPTYRHPVGMTVQVGGSNSTLLSSSADWISLGHQSGVDREINVVEATGDKVVILDTDHLANNITDYYDSEHRAGYTPQDDLRARRAWVWKSFTMGYNPVYMDQMYEGDDTSFGGAKLLFDYRNGAYFGDIEDSPHRGEVRCAMGDTRDWAESMPLIDMTPHPELSSTGYVLAKVGEEYLVYQPTHGQYLTVYLPANTYNIEWFDPDTAYCSDEGPSTFLVDEDQGFTPPSGFLKDAVLHITIHETGKVDHRPR